MTALPPPAVLAAFDARAQPVPLPGGGGRTVAAGSLVLKSIDDPVEAEWIAEVVRDLDGGDAIRIARPVASHDGRWVVGSWTAWQRVPGEHVTGRWLDVLQVSDQLSSALAGVPEPAFLAKRTHPWAVGDRVAWGAGLPGGLPPDFAELLASVLALRQPVDAGPTQPIHGDLCGNVLFADGLPPAVIDFSPFFRPAGYAKAIVAFDAIAWEGAGGELLDRVGTRTTRKQLLVRAAIFRLTAGALLAIDDPARLGGDRLAPYERAVRLIDALPEE